MVGQVCLWLIVLVCRFDVSHPAGTSGFSAPEGGYRPSDAGVSNGILVGRDCCRL
ncbi:hypothetical protein AtDm6_3271 [Acetobacter tropicalis]|uniref:Uncharacterized protein n=1 Tax=Acetobacter tropicalis TaxID=104102 RepID=A0A094ZE58_9PROT|nr:hypothetical protein AtDm6_3271 [Acetobacter tropicalis]